MGPPAKLRREPKFVKAGLFWGWFLRRYGFYAIWMPWRRVYCLDDRVMEDPVIREHERVHSEQAEREGLVIFCASYLFWIARRGYWDNPYEVEARSRYGYNWGK
jgi:hypothetical protein